MSPEAQISAPSSIGFRLPLGRVAFWLLLALVAGFSAFSRQFAYIAIGPLYVTEIVLGALLLLHLALVLKQPKLILPRLRSARMVLYLVCLYLAFSVLRLLPDLLGGSALEPTLRNFGIAHYALFAPLGYLTFARDPVRRARALMWVIIVCSTATNAVTMIAYFLGGNSLLDPYTKVLSGQAGLFAVLSALFLIALLLERRARMKSPSPALYGLLALQPVFVYFAGHRSGLIALGVGLVLVALAGDMWRALGIGAVALVLSATLLLRIGPLASAAEVVGTKYATLFGGTLDEPNAYWRYLYWMRVLEAWQVSPAIGLGFGADLASLAPWQVGAPGERIDPHNSYLTVLARQGLLGAAIVAAIVALFFASLYTSIRTALGSGRKWTVVAITASFGAVAVYATMNVVLEGPYHGAVFWLLIGAGVAIQLPSQRPT